MRSFVLGLVAAVALSSSIAHADLGPPPKCEDGSHAQYLYGQNCVKDGYHLEPAASGGGQLVTVKDSDGTIVTPPPAATTQKKGCSFSASGQTRDETSVATMLMIAGVAFVRARGRSRG